MNGYIKESYQGGVYNRLYLDSKVRKTKQDNLDRVSTPQSSLRPTVETLLLQKHAKSQAKLATLRHQQQLKEVDQLKPVPKINKISKQIVGVKEGFLSSSISLYTAKLMNSSRSASTIRAPPKQSFLSLAELEESGDYRGVIRVKEEPVVEKEEFRMQEFAVLRRDEDENKEKDLQELRKAVFERCKLAEPMDPNPAFLSMSVVDRNTHWLKSRDSRLSLKKELQKKQETSNCTFSPKLTPRIEAPASQPKPPPQSFSYLSKYTSRPSKPPAAKTDSVNAPLSKPKPSLLYKSLSPHERTLSQGSSLSLLSKARPMLPYNI
jgi:hypothetical protein